MISLYNVEEWLIRAKSNLEIAKIGRVSEQVYRWVVEILNK
jgi:hypothetical protein